MNKKSYINNNITDNYIELPEDIKKWTDAMYNIYNQKKYDFNEAFNLITKNWNDMEKKDFKHWMSFYQENAHQKYKTAQFIPNLNSLKSSLPTRELDVAPYPVKYNEEEQKKIEAEIVEKKIQSLIGRLNSAERIVTNPAVQKKLKQSLQMSVDEWVSLLQKLKREIQLTPMRFANLDLIDDIIYKNANQIANQGNKKAAVLLIKTAQNIPAVNLPPNLPSNLPKENEENNAIVEFLKNINNTDISDTDDDLQAKDEDKEADIVVTAQEIQPNLPSKTAPIINKKPSLEVKEKLSPNIKNISGDPFDQALANVKIPDIVSRLEGIASMFKNRQIARQLSVIDLMMDKVGIAPFFPTLAEAMRSALESNQYCQSRVEEILAKLRGSIVTPMSEHLSGEISGENALKEDQVKLELAKQEEAEIARKQHRKEIQQQEEDAALVPNPPKEPNSKLPSLVTTAPQDLATPSQIKSSPPLRPAG